MIVRIRIGHSAKSVRKPRQQRRFAIGVASLLTPAACLAGALGLWRIAADLNLTGSFAIASGFFSHWQVWMGAAIALQLGAQLLNRYAKSGETAAS